MSINALDRSRYNRSKLAGYGFAHFIPLKHLRVVCRLGQLVRYLAIE